MTTPDTTPTPPPADAAPAAPAAPQTRLQIAEAKASRLAADAAKAKAQATALRQKLTAMQRTKAKSQDRKTADRQKILLGAYLLKCVPPDQLPAIRIGDLSLDAYLVKPADRAVMGLPALAGDTNTSDQGDEG